MKKKISLITLFICFNIILTAQTRGYSNFDNVGQQAFSILQNMTTASFNQFSAHFSSNIVLAENLTGKKIPSDYISSMYNDLKKAGSSSNIKWSAIKFKRIIQGRAVEESGILNYKGRLFFEYSGKEYPASIRVIQYQGKYYLIGIGI